ncbi:hypothetical protein H735_15665 [Vibrio owensii CAIM 1854 = LMG 25443]|uniref:Uncharacterized protein n=2 Tax=Vibrio owensii TaxID=696485 RepID=A0A0C1W768_9VIBR|nr:hypothetical protein H735_15665 [Vibrio owensii CAIM 1854 = LMG 25443]
MINKKLQEGGDSSTNIQAEQITLNVGIDEKRAREIYQEMNLQLRKEYSQEAFDIANIRINEFENRLMPKMEIVDGALEAFADPSFQLLLLEAQKTAAATERPADYDLLAELLLHRFQKREDRIVRAGVTRAVEIVDEIADDALLGLTVFHSVNTFLPVAGNINSGLDALDSLFGKVMYNTMPTGSNWLDHLDILDAVRLSPFGGLKKIEQFYPELLSGYIDAGIKKDSDDYLKAVAILQSNQLPKDLLIVHELNENYVRIPVTRKEHISSILIYHRVLYQGTPADIPLKLTDIQIQALNSIYDLYSNENTLKENNTILFMKKWNEKHNLKALSEWWNKMDVSFQVTSVGRVLAHANAQRCENKLPPLE